jgi:hypothetical protein
MCVLEWRRIPSEEGFPDICGGSVQSQIEEAPISLSGTPPTPRLPLPIQMPLRPTPSTLTQEQVDDVLGTRAAFSDDDFCIFDFFP